MKIRIVSDIHLEFDSSYKLPIIEDEETMTLVLAGDITNIRKLKHHVGFFVDCAARHKYVLYVFGNHEFYDEHMSTAVLNFTHAMHKAKITNLWATSDGGTAIIDDIEFIMATLWTGWNLSMSMLNVSNDHSMVLAQRFMPDFCWITDENNHSLTPMKTKEIHEKHLTFIINALAKSKTDKRVVITHHGPSIKSIHVNYWKNNLNPAFVSDLSDIIDQYKPDIWIHGHVHQGFDYMDNEKTRIIVNPKGYPGENMQFNPSLVIEL